MIASNRNSLCLEAQKYYYDYLFMEEDSSIPASLVSHINKCAYCQEEIKRLNKEISGIEIKSNIEEKRNSVIANNLKLHFFYAEKLVTCDAVKPFLPGLANLELSVSIPTPITVHIDKCSQCFNDLEKVEGLRLTHRQLCTLGQLMDKHEEKEICCQDIDQIINSASSFDYGGISSFQIKHISTCPNCRNKLSQRWYQMKNTADLGGKSNNMFPCENVSLSDLFDYCFPYNLDPSDDEYMMFRPSFTSHIANCPVCLDKLIKLQTTISEIINRTKSGITTYFKVDDHVKTYIEKGAREIYSDWPIEVKVYDNNRREKPIKPGIHSFGSFRQIFSRDIKIPTISLKPMIKPLAAAAAILIVAILFLKTPNAGADLDDIYKALGKINNIYISSFDPDHKEDINEKWISKKKEILLFKGNSGKTELWDMKNRIKKTRIVNTQEFATEELNDIVLNNASKLLNVPWDLLPFDSITSLPKNAKCRYIENLSNDMENTRTLELIWVETLPGGLLVESKWRGYIDADTEMLNRIEFWEKLGDKEEYQLTKITNIRVLSDQEMTGVMKEYGF